MSNDQEHQQPAVDSVLRDLEQQNHVLQQQQQRVRDAIEAIRALKGDRSPVNGIPVEMQQRQQLPAVAVETGPFAGMTTPDAVAKVLKDARKPLAPNKIAATLAAAGFGAGRKKHQAYKNVYAALSNAKGTRFKRVGEKWTLK